MEKPTATRERKISRKKTNFISHEIAYLYADCRSNKYKNNRKKCTYHWLCIVHVSLVSFFVSVVLHFLIGLLFIRLSFANFCHVKYFNELGEKAEQLSNIVHFYALACLVDSHASIVVFAAQMDRVYVLFVHLFVFALFSAQKWNDWNVTTSTITTETEKKTKHKNRSHKHSQFTITNLGSSLWGHGDTERHTHSMQQ